VRATNIRLSLVAGAVLAHAAALATPAEEQLRKDMAALMQRVERLEKDNRELRGRVEGQATAPKGWNAPVEQRVQALEQSRETTERALASERLSENEPEMATRLKAVEFQMQGLQKQARQIEALEGISASASLTGVVQGVNDGGAVDQKGHSRASYRGDLSVALPGGSMGDIDGKIFTHLRFGQGTGVALRPTYTSAVNSTAFETSAGPDDSFAILAQAWYQLDIPLPRGGYRPHSRERIELNVGKMDPFLFFDQNAIADDETVRFLNNAFVHNPLLDSGGDTGADAYGFAPGARIAYFSQPSRSSSWGASLGAFATNEGANFSGSLGKPFVMGQLETSQRPFAGLPGNYRAYAWHNGRASDADGTTAVHSGFGLSFDQRVSDGVSAFARYGHQLAGKPRFDRALTFGGEADGGHWGRGADGVGMAAGWLRTDSSYGASGAANSNERIVELYYRWQLNPRVQISPDFQWIANPGGQADAPTVRAIGLRAKVGL
jgi:high affinity Mn2+ porin